MAIIKNPGVQENNSRGKNQNGVNRCLENVPRHSGRNPFLMDEGENIEDIISGKISSRNNLVNERESRIYKMNWLNSESELNKKIRQDAKKPTLHFFERKNERMG
jgi:hypothetical protein